MESSPHSRLTFRDLTAYLVAIFLPLCASYLTNSSPLLQGVPFGLYFLIIALAGVLGGLGPALTAATSTLIGRNLFIEPAHRLLAFTLTDFIRIPTLYLQAILVAQLNIRRRQSREQLEDALLSLQDRSDALVQSLQSSKCASWLIDLDSPRTTQFFHGSYQIFGRPFTDIETANSVEPFLHPDDLEAFRENRRQMRHQTNPIVWEYRVPWPNGELHWLEMRATRVPGPLPLWRGITVDITERKLAETAMLRQEKLAAMGRLASTVAHEINNPLEAVTNLLYLARNEPALPEQAGLYLATAETELARLGEITRLTLGFVRSGATRRAVEIAAVAEDVFSIFRHRYEMKNIRVDRTIEPGIFIHIAPHELRQVLTNLISNAADALNVPDPRVSICIAREHEEAVFLLEDNGTGISPDKLDRIFEPFFTTKPEVGTGIGLWVTRELVENNGGQITVESGTLDTGMSTRFRVAFPLQQTPP